MVHAAQTRVAAGRATCRGAHPWARSRARWALAYRRRRLGRLGRGCSPPPSTVECAAVRHPAAYSPPRRALRLVNPPYPLLLLPRRRRPRPLPPRLSVKGICRRRMGWTPRARLLVRRIVSGIPREFCSRGTPVLFARMRMMMMTRGGIGVGTVALVRSFTEPARLAFLMTSVLSRLRLPRCGGPRRRDRPLAASTERAPVTRVPLSTGERRRAFPCPRLQPRRRWAPAGSHGGRSRKQLVRTFAPLTRSVRGTLLLVLRPRPPRVVQSRLGTGPGSRRILTRPRPSHPPRRRLTGVSDRGMPHRGCRARALVRHVRTWCHTPV